MHNAPSVSYPVGRSRFFGLMLGVLWLAGAALVVAWCWDQAIPGWRQATALASLPISAACARHSWRAMCPGILRWDGQVWLWRPSSLGEGADAEPVTLHAHLDLQRHLLVSLRQSSGQVAWCWLESVQMPLRWADLRRAVYSPARPQAVLDDAPEPPVKPAAPASPET
ncbi:MAG: hypothetical protein JWQ88_1571 [Rhodoferax sp.]|nr:hypothetical protein [Rhodoferax sp.]